MSKTVAEAIEKIRAYVRDTRGFEPDDAAIADALTRYFVLKEIGDHLAMAQDPGSEEGGS